MMAARANPPLTLSKERVRDLPSRICRRNQTHAPRATTNTNKKTLTLEANVNPILRPSAA